MLILNVGTLRVRLNVTKCRIFKGALMITDNLVVLISMQFTPITHSTLVW